MKKMLQLILLTLFLTIACSDDPPGSDVIPNPDPITPIEPVEPASYSSALPSNINVVYFIPNDQDTIADYQRRLSGIMLHTQEWYKKEMERNGFGQKTFGLLVNDDNPESVKIHVIRGERSSSHYPYDGGGARVILEVEAYFEQNPSEKASDHAVIFMPSVAGDHGWDAGGVPFYGAGRWCFALDYKYFDMDTWRDGSREGETNWIGGTMHEIGHALNLPHTQHKATDNWTSLMAWGNHEYNSNPNGVHLTMADAIILNNNQVFNNQPEGNFYNLTPAHTFQSLSIFTDETNIYLQGKFDASVPVNGVSVYHDPHTNSGDLDYNAVAWATTDIINNDSISMVMPLAGINAEYRQFPFELRVLFAHTNGNMSYENFNYEFENGRPNIDVHLTQVDEVDKSNWTIDAYSSEEASGEGPDNGHARHAIDNNTETFWHSAWQRSQPNYPHTLTVDLNRDQEIRGFTFSQRTNKFNGRPNDITISISSDGTNFENFGSFQLSSSTLKQSVALSEMKTARYFKLEITHGHDNGNGEDIFFTHLAEVGIY